MEYYTKRKNYRFIKVILLIIIIFVIFNIFIVFFDKRVLPSILEISNIMAKNQALNIINEKSIEILNEDFKYDEMIRIQRDNEGNINLIQADNVKLNYIAAKLSNECNKEFENMKDVKISVPLGWSSNRSIFYRIGPNINMYIEPIGNIETSYESKFESAGINQTRHKIYLNITAQIRMKMPIANQETTVTTQVPVSDTIIVGKIPNMAWSIENEH
ncbi:sporulation protein YunB [uncultured Clostridium sp.]|uniref:sporulation protein YunB n=1 Tax=uncultured Clostridium sp. TaxID=59620 RepID=UPI0025E47F77|nr:sporulation protein YunB [uncultured Clostridium sp.]